MNKLSTPIENIELCPVTGKEHNYRGHPSGVGIGCREECGYYSEGVIENTELLSKAKDIVRNYNDFNGSLSVSYGLHRENILDARDKQLISDMKELISQEILSNLNRIMKAGQVAAIDGTDHDIVVAVEKTIDAEKAKYTNLGGSE